MWGVGRSEITDSLDVANAFNKYFSTILNTMAENLAPAPDLSVIWQILKFILYYLPQ